MSTRRLKGPQTHEFQKRNRRGEFRWGGMVPDGNPGGLAPNEPRVLINVRRREGGDFVARGGQEKLTTLDFGSVRSLIDTRQAVGSRLYWFSKSGQLGWFDNTQQDEWALHHSTDDSGDLPPDFFADQLMVAGRTDNAGAILGVSPASGVSLLPLSEMRPFHVFPIPSTGVVYPPSSGIPFFSSPPEGVVAPYLPIVVYSFAPAMGSFPTTRVAGARVHSPYILIFIRQVTNLAGSWQMVCDPFDGSKLLTRETVVPVSAGPGSENFPLLSFAEPWRDRLVVGFRNDAGTFAAVQKLFIRPAGTPPQTWLAVSPAAGVLTSLDGGISYKGNFYVIGDNAGVKGTVWKYDGTTLSLDHTIASVLHDFRGAAVGTDGKLYFAYWRNDGGGAVSPRLASFDGTTWVDAALNFRDQFPDIPTTIPSDFNRPFVQFAGGACIMIPDGINSYSRAYFTTNPSLLGTWRRTSYPGSSGLQPLPWRMRGF